jgi:hypothetical protein
MKVILPICLYFLVMTACCNNYLLNYFASHCLTSLQDVLNFCFQLSDEINVVDSFWNSEDLMAGAIRVESLPLRRNVFAQFAQKVLAFCNLVIKILRLSRFCF